MMLHEIVVAYIILIVQHHLLPTISLFENKAK
jgi:hypothetical protein